MKYKYSNNRILIFAREPVLGKVKTRLQSTLGLARTFDLHCALIKYQVEQVDRNSLVPVELWVTSNPSHEVFQNLSGKPKLFEQWGDDLGHRMMNAAEAALQRVESVVIIGSDCPSVDSDYLEQALRLLGQGTEIVIGPAEDGGYVLLGMNRITPEIFLNIPWGSEQVMEITLQRLKVSGLSFKLLEPRWDVDRPEDLARLAELQPPFSY